MARISSDLVGWIEDSGNQLAGRSRELYHHWDEKKRSSFHGAAILPDEPPPLGSRGAHPIITKASWSRSRGLHVMIS